MVPVLNPDGHEIVEQGYAEHDATKLNWRASETTGRRIFYEWTLIEGKNDTAEHARAVGELLRGLPAQVNLIPLNPTSGYDGAPTRSEAAKQFQKILADEFKLPSTVRQRRGIDIAAGCGQLATMG